MFAEAQVITIILYLTFIKETYPFSEVLQRHTHTLSSLSALSYLRLSLSLAPGNNSHLKFPDKHLCPTKLQQLYRGDPDNPNNPSVLLYVK